jgi:hypothetical protein
MSDFALAFDARSGNRLTFEEKERVFLARCRQGWRRLQRTAAARAWFRIYFRSPQRRRRIKVDDAAARSSSRGPHARTARPHQRHPRRHIYEVTNVVSFSNGSP